VQYLHHTTMSHEENSMDIERVNNAL
jgi:hypothetical protein